MELFYSFMVFVLGCCIGSFSNVGIYRWHVGTSVIKGRSHCDTCGSQISWYDNIPILSYILLGGKCRHCHVQLSLQYPFVELLTGLIFLAIYSVLGQTMLTVKLLFVSWLFIVATVSDILYYEVPDELTYISIPVMIGLVLCGENTWMDLGLGVLFPGVLFFVIAMIIEAILGKLVIGGGDIKFLFSIGGIMGSGFAMAIFIIGCFCLSLIYFSKIIEDMVEDKHSYVPMLVGFAMAYFLVLMCHYLVAPQFDIANDFIFYLFGGLLYM